MKSIPRVGSAEFAEMIAAKTAVEFYREIITEGTERLTDCALMMDQIEDFAFARAYLTHLGLREVVYAPVTQDHDIVYDVRTGLTYVPDTGESW